MLTSLIVRLALPLDMAEVFALRHEVFVVGQGVPAALERDDIDQHCVHVLARLDGVVVGTGRLVPGRVADDGTLQAATVATVGRLAVAGATRGAGVGARLLALLEQQAALGGVPVVELHAQVHAQGFYERAGYASFGTVYQEAGIDHIGMHKQL